MMEIIFGGFVVKVTLIEIETCFPNANSTHQIIWGFEVSMAIRGCNAVNASDYTESRMSLSYSVVL